MLWIKVGFQLLLTLPCTVIAGMCMSVAFGFALWQAVALLIAARLFAVGHAVFGMLMGLCFPKLDAVNETVIIKQSMASVLAMFVPMTFLGMAAGLYSWGSKITQWIALALPIALFALFAAVSTLVLARQGASMLRKL